VLHRYAGALREAQERTPLENDPRGWPEGVSCEMDLSAWAEALTRAGIEEKYANVLDGFQHGFTQGITQHTLGEQGWYTPKNHETAELAQEEITDNLRKEVAAGQMFGPYSHDKVAQKFKFFRSSPLGTAVNSDGSVRPINNLLYPYRQNDTPLVNLYVNKDNFNTTWDNFKTVARFFRKNPITLSLGLFDWEKAYRQIPTQLDQWPFLMVKDMDGGLLLDTRITFGGVAGCRLFGRPANSWKEVMKSEFDLVHIFCWVDDNLFVKLPQSQVQMEDVVKRLARLGVKTNVKKYSEFDNKQKFIGFVWNGLTRTV
jgi:hypothetical protein